MKITMIPAKRENAKTRVAVYCRVSTEKDQQEDSLEMQREAYLSLISERSDWEPAGVYSDTISGLRAEKRPEFMQMVWNALDGKIDRILCKSVSRFSRNVAECKKYTDMLRMKNVTVEFEKEHLSTEDPTSTFIFSLMSAIAENESRSISENVKWANRERVKRGEYNLGNNRILGYDTVDRKLVPNGKADAVRLIYRLFANGHTIGEIQRHLTGIGVKARSGNAISRSGIFYILKNETYKGDKILQKTHPKDLITKRPDPRVAFESNYLIEDHEAIVTRDMWDTVQQKLKENKKMEETVGHRGGHPHFLYGKVFCGECGEPMLRKTWRTGKVWVCRGRSKGKAGNGCMCRNVREEELLSAGNIKKITVIEGGIMCE